MGFWGFGDLHDVDPGVGEVPGQAGAVGAGAFDPDRRQRSEGDQEGQQSAIADRCGRERLGAQDSTEVVAGCGDVDVGVGVHAPDDSAGT